MLVLAIDTSQRVGGVAIVEDQEIRLELSFNIMATYSKSLVPAIHNALDLTELTFSSVDAVAVGIGPGSFTGLRIGVASSKAIAFSMGIPIVGVPSLDAIVEDVVCELNTLICPIVDAKKRQVFTALYRMTDHGPRRIGPYLAIRPELLVERLPRGEKCILFGDGLRQYGDVFESLIKSLGLDTVTLFKNTVKSVRPGLIGSLSMRKLLTDPKGQLPHELDPLYLRPSDAEIKRFGIGEEIFEAE